MSLLETAEGALRTAAVAAGIAEAAVLRKSERESLPLLPPVRLQIEVLDGQLDRKPRRVAKFASPTQPETHRVVRSRVYAETLVLRAELAAEIEAEVESLARTFLLALPRCLADAQGNVVRVRAQRATRGGYAARMVEAMPTRTVSVHVAFVGMVTRDEEIPLILDVNLVDGMSAGKEA